MSGYAPARDLPAAELRAALERSLDVLLATVIDPTTDPDVARSSMALRDAVASHLRAVDELTVADARPERRMDLLLRAADLVERS